MDNRQSIKTFNYNNAPFYIVDHEDGQFSLCLPFSFLSDEYTDFGQSAFNRYAEKIGNPIQENGLYTHGNGYEWEAVFKKVFEDNENINQITFDCEAGGFFCCANDLTLLEDMGSCFREKCLNEDSFSELVCIALAEDAIRKAADAKLRDTIRGFFIECPDCEAEIKTPDGEIFLTAEQGQQLLNGTLKSLLIGDSVIDAEDLLGQEITHYSQDLIKDRYFQMITERPVKSLETEQNDDNSIGMTM